MAIKFNQYWDLTTEHKSEYAEFVQEEFLPCLKELGIQVVAGWVVQVGESPRIISEGIARDIRHIDAMLESKDFHSMITRHMRYVRNYSSKILVASGRVEEISTQIPPEEIVKFNQSWNIRPGQEEAYAEAFHKHLIPTLEGVGIEVVAEWNVVIGSGPFMILEGHALTLEAIASALTDPKYRRLMALWEDLVEQYQSRILVRHRFFLQLIREVYGTPIRSISEKDTSSMYGPLID
ncbi:hypothetical protein ACFLZG_07560 [Thermodesulfobacteriota bacterium]